MVPMKSTAVPIDPYGTAVRAGAKRRLAFGTNPFPTLAGGFDPGMVRVPGMAGMGACSCGPTGGCECISPMGFSGLAQSPSLDSIIQNATSWLGSFASSQLPPSAAVPPAVGSTGALINTVMGLAPYLLIGFLAYKALK